MSTIHQKPNVENLCRQITHLHAIYGLIDIRFSMYCWPRLHFCQNLTSNLIRRSALSVISVPDPFFLNPNLSLTVSIGLPLSNWPISLLLSHLSLSHSLPLSFSLSLPISLGLNHSVTHTSHHSHNRWFLSTLSTPIIQSALLEIQICFPANFWNFPAIFYLFCHV